MTYICNSCGEELLGWAGKCPHCGQWGSIEQVEVKSGIGTKASASKVEKLVISEKKKAVQIERIKTGIKEFDRVLGGGIFPGEAILMSGQPGIGKSTLLLQVVYNIAKKGKVIYISGEESADQVRDRFYRIENTDGKDPIENNLLFSSTIEVESIIALIEKEKPTVVVVDSIQTVQSDQHQSFAGSISQVKICGGLLTKCAKRLNIPIIMVGQINKQGLVAGPKILEHLVDCVISFEGDENNQFRILRCIKNRFGSINEIGVFSMGQNGLEEVANPSTIFLECDNAVAGSAIGVVQKASRVIFLEVQALVIKRDNDGMPLKRVGNGIKKNRIDMLCAILSKRGGTFLSDKDVFLNIVGGMDVADPSLDLAICAAIQSAVSDKKITSGAVFVGEVGLTGAVKSGWGIDRVVKEANRLGYKKLFVGKLPDKKPLGVIEITDIKDLKFSH